VLHLRHLSALTQHPLDQCRSSLCAPASEENVDEPQ
jgi:hypothetical protein